MFHAAPILLGQSRPADSYPHQPHARAPLLPITVVLVFGLLSDSFMFYAVILVALVAALLGSGVRAGQLVRNFKPIILLVVITAAYHLAFSGGRSEIWWAAGPIRIREEAVRQAGFFSLRLVLFVSIAFLLTLTTAPSELADAIAQLLRPLERIRVPVQDLALILFMAMRFIPVLYDEFQAIKYAQMIRGVRFTGSMINRIRKTVSIIIPVFVAALQRADDLALAIEARGYKGGVKRTIYTRLRFETPEWVFALGASGAVVILWALTR